MKKNLFIAIVITIMAATITSCGSDKVSDFQPYAVGEGCYFDASDFKNAKAFIGKRFDRTETYTKIGLGIHGFMVHYDKVNLDVDKEMFHLLQTNSSGRDVNDYENYSMHIVVQKGKYLPEGEEVFFSENYYTFNDEKFKKAVETFKATSKTENLPSRFDAKADGGVKTYHSKIIAAIAYNGMEKRLPSKFVSLYLECGAVIQIFDEPMAKKFEGKTIDCVVDKNNNVVGKDFTLNK